MLSPLLAQQADVSPSSEPAVSGDALAVDDSTVDLSKADSSGVMQRVEQIDSRIGEIEEKEGSLRDEILQVRRQATDLDRNYQSLLGQLEQLEKEQRELEQKLKEQRETAEKAARKQQQSSAAAQTAKQELEAAQQRLAEADKKADEADAEAKSAAKRIDEMQTQLAALAPKLKPLMMAAEQAKEASAALHQRIAAMEGDVTEFARQRDEHQREIESLLRDAGQWVSFTDQIAPIFHHHCVACHNARNSQGRYNMAKFDSILSFGESGQAIETGDAESSLLVQLIEDGSMPYDADPLSDEQIALIRRWVDLGARLDSGADRDSPLIRLMPPVQQPAPPQRYRVPIPVTALAARGELVASSGYHEVLLWSLSAEADTSEETTSADSGQDRSTTKLVGRISGLAERIHALAFHPDGRRLAVASGTPGQLGQLKLFDAQLGEMLADLLISEDAIFDVAFSPDGSHLAACGADGTIAIFPLDDAESRPLLIEDHADWVNSIAWSPDGKQLVSTSRDKTAKVFDTESGKLKITFSGHNQNVTAAVFLADSKRVVSGGDDRKLRVWNTDDGQQVRDISGLGSEIAGVILLDKDRVISAGADRKIRIHAAADGKLIKELVTPSDWLSSLAVTADRETILFGNHVGQIHRANLKGTPAVKQTWLAVPD